MQRKRMRPIYWPTHHYPPFKVPQHSEGAGHFPPNWRQLPPPRFVHSWQTSRPLRPYNSAPFPPSLRAHSQVPPVRPLRRPLPRPPTQRNPNFYLTRRRWNARLPDKPKLNPADPLNLHDLMNEADRRRVEGLSPLRGDSRLNTPALSELNNASPSVPPVLSINPTSGRPSGRDRTRFRGRRGFVRGNRRSKWQNKRLPVTGNYPNYYSRRDPEDRLKFLLPEWFVNCDAADYGCHNGTFTFRILEKFPEAGKIDAFDCDPELIANAKSMQRERIRWGPQSSAKYDKINFQVADWSVPGSCDDEPAYDTVMAFSVTKWIHLNYGDAGLMRFFRRVFNLLRPGGRFLLEPQPKSSYKRTRITPMQQENYKNLTIDPANLEPILLDVGFSYFDIIKVPQPKEAFQRTIMLCTKSVGDTPSTIRNDCRDEAQLWRGSPALSDLSNAPIGPPPVNYYPQTPSYAPIVSPRTHLPTPESIETVQSPPGDCLQSEIISSTVTHSQGPDDLGAPPGEATPLASSFDEADGNVDTFSSAPDSTSGRV